MSPLSQSLTILDHPLVDHKLSILRAAKASSMEFRSLLREIGWFLAVEATKSLPVEPIEIETPVCKTTAKRVSGKKATVVSILRAGDGLLMPFLDVMPSARVGHIGIARNEETLQPDVYSMKLPGTIEKRPIFVVDPMLATGGSAIKTIDILKEKGAKTLTFACLVAAPEGVDALRAAHPDVPIVTAALDEKLNENGYIVPGLGDAGDRIFGTQQR